MSSKSAKSSRRSAIAHNVRDGVYAPYIRAEVLELRRSYATVALVNETPKMFPSEVAAKKKTVVVALHSLGDYFK
jgi:hypothetical protein